MRVESFLEAARSLLLSPLRWILLAVTSLACVSSTDAQTISPPVERGEVLELTVSFLLIDLLDIHDTDQSIEADLFFQVEWHDPRLGGAGEELRIFSLDEVWYPRVSPASPREVSELLDPVVTADDEGNASYTQRLIGTFGAPTYLAEFPLDAHTFRLEFLFPSSTLVELMVVGGGESASDELSIPGWTIGEGRLDTIPIDIAAEYPRVPGFSYVFRGTRNAGHYVTKVIFPLVVIVMMSWAVFWAPPAQINIQFGFAATSILTVIAYRFALANQVPPVSYGTRLDDFLNGSFLLAFLALVEVIVTARLIYRDRTPAAEKLDTICRVVFPLALIGLSIYAFAL